MSTSRDDLGSASRGSSCSVADRVAPRAGTARVSATVTGMDGAILATVSRRNQAAAPGRDPADTLGVVTVEGDVDADTAPLLLRALRETIDAHRRVRCDLSRVSVFAAAGANAVLAAHQHAHSTGGRLTVRGAHGWTLRVLTITGLDGVLRLEA